MSFPYPPSPILKDDSFLQPSESFKTQAKSTIKGIAGFVLLYVFLMLASVGLLVACGFLGVGLISVWPSWITLVAGLGIMALGVMVFLFLIKFIFAETVENDPLQIEIFEHEYPELFAFIRKLTQEVQTEFPKRIFLMPDVNASVLYNSSFWSMFLPVRKNLRIGLGLVNSLTVSEFKATLAHEFGHFSQRSMKLGSYVYTMNKVIYDLVNHRDRWDNTLESWANTGGLFSVFAGLTHWIVNQVRGILIYAYKKLNVGYMALSREMEYHADLVACSVAGNEPMIQTLRKIEFADSSYNYALNKLNQMASEKKKTTNLYTLHQRVSTHMATLFKLGVVNDAIVIRDTDLQQNLVASRINMKDQWASHPSREEREASINTIQLHVDLVAEPAWVLFKGSEKCMQEMTNQLYSIALPQHQEFAAIADEEFMASILVDESKNTFAKVYNGFYDNRLIKEFDLTEAIKQKTDRAFEELFHVSTAEFFKRHAFNQNDLDNLRLFRISIQKSDVFEFDHKKYKASEIAQVLEMLQKDVEEGNKTALQYDRHAFQYFYERIRGENERAELIDAYSKVFDSQKYVRNFNVLIERWQGYNQTLQTKTEWSEGEVGALNSGLTDMEKHFKAFLDDLPNSITDGISEKEEFEKYASGRLNYMTASFFSEEGYQRLTGRMFEVLGLLHENSLGKLKSMTEMQLTTAPIGASLDLPLLGEVGNS